jgi:outer membrane protein OmpA-like peptidoglycan-associated protein
MGDEASAEVPSDTEQTEGDIEKDEALAEASSSDFTDPHEVQLNGDVPSTTRVDPIDNAATPETPVMADAPIGLEIPEIANEPDLEVNANSTVYFAKSSSRVTREYRQQLREIALKLKSDRNLKVTLLGHCDIRGSAAFNRRLAKQRVRAVKSALMKMGVTSKQISLGAPQLAQSGATEAEHAQNRRVEVEFQ